MFFCDPAHAVFIISKISFCTKPTVISSFSTTALFQLKVDGGFADPKDPMKGDDRR